MVNFSKVRKMFVKSNTKMILIGAAFLMAIVGCSVAIARAITNDDFDSGIGRICSAKIVREIRDYMNNTDLVTVPIQAYIIPSVDAHQNEYISQRDKRVEFVSGFNGSAATIVIEEKTAAFWTDIRYHKLAEKQLDKRTWTLMKSGLAEVPTIEEWLIATLPPNSLVGVDPFLIKASDFQERSEKLQAQGHKLVTVQQNLVDLVWKNRPELKLKDLETHTKSFSGKIASEKVADVREAIKTKLVAESLIVTALDEVAWLLNLRGTDIKSNPVFFAYVIITQTELYLYLRNEKRFTPKISNHFKSEGIEVIVKEYSKVLAGLDNVIRATKGKIVLSSASEAIQSVVPVERQLIAESPIVMMKVIKNNVEAEGMRQAHIRDGVALVKYLFWLENSIDHNIITELNGAEQLKIFRSEQEFFRGSSFDSISAVGANAAIPHYIPTSGMDKPITREEIYLIDSGGQYLDGTTDVTRTIHFGTPTDTEIDAFTRVLKGFISLSTAIFPSSAPFSFFDAMARRSLWDVGLDYGHGTGHGVGSYLNVHEYPPLISSKNSGRGMMKNMFTTNEPAYYEDEKFGIRIEDIIQVVQAPQTEQYFNGKGALKFDDITMVPIQIKLINVNLLTENEIDWINAYHQRVRDNVTPLLCDNKTIVDWLTTQTDRITKKKDHEDIRG